MYHINVHIWKHICTSQLHTVHVTMHTCTVHADIMSIAKIYNKYNVTFFSWVPAQEKVNACAH